MLVGRPALAPPLPRAVLRLPVPQTGFPHLPSTTTPAPTGHEPFPKKPLAVGFVSPLSS